MVYNEFNRNDRDEICVEPEFQVFTDNGAMTVNKYILTVIVGRTERKHDVDQKESINHQFTRQKNSRVALYKSESIWGIK